ncbi:hypothetical protein Gotri_016066 [Gossypium trilobum]|uniref:Cytochrome P450 n=1 Tax=Gossypium trilobum TaxID=34281 RepID=A0A7J9E266_9ROSI|nr:hypothetical protein [Gossypium trilobum]
MSPTLALVFALLGTLSSFIYIFRPTKSRSNHNKNGQKLPPGPRALPIIGNLHMLGKLPHQNLHHLAKRYGPIMSLRLGCVPTIVVSSPEAAELFLKTHDLVFASRPGIQAGEYLSYGSTGMAFTPYVRKTELGSLVESVKESAAARETVNLSEKVGELIEKMMCKIIFGRSNDDRFNLRSLIDQTMHLSGAFNISDFVPYLAPLDLQGLGRRLKRASELVDTVLEKIIDEHMQGTDAEDRKPHRDFVDVMISMLNQPMNPHDKDETYIIKRKNIKAILLDMIAASFESSAVAIVWTFSEIWRHPRVMVALQHELETVVGRNRLVEESDLSKLTYLDMVVKEGLRLHPVAPFLVPHESIEDIVINGYFIPKKSRILVNIWSMGRDRNIWSENAEEFFPERFINNNIDLRGHDFRLIPFGSGRRGCPGMHLALINVSLILAQLVHCFNWELPDGMLPDELNVTEIFGLSLPRATHLLAKPTYRLLGLAT